MTLPEWPPPTRHIITGFSKEDREAFGLKYNVPVFESIEKLLKEISPDIVSICSPYEFHFEHTMQCLRSSIPMVWLEKPAAADKDG